MSLKGRLRRLERESGGGFVSIPQAGGAVFKQSRKTADLALYSYLYEGALRGMPPDTPEIIHALTNAADRAGAVNEYLARAYEDLLFFDVQQFIETGVIVPLGENPAEDLSEGARH